MAWKCEVTDTFGGEANYSWVRRATIPAGPENEPQRSIMKRAKHALQLTGMRGVTTRMNGFEGYEFRPSGMCMVAFVQWDNWSVEGEAADAKARPTPTVAP